MGDKNISVDGSLLAIIHHKELAQKPNTCSQINDDKSFIRSDFEAGRVPAEHNSGRAWTGN
jgi:hypothetical protein